LFVCCYDGGSFAVDHRLGVDEVTVVFVYDKDVLIAGSAGGERSTGRVGK
jgi:hypothetical protein